MKRLVVQTVAEHLRVDVRAARAGVLEFLDHERRRAFAHHEAVAQTIKRPAAHRADRPPAAHRLDEIKRAKSELAQRRLGAAGDDHIGQIIADVAERFADGDHAAGAGVRVRRARAAEAALDGDIGMRGAAEDLQRERLVHARVRPFFRKCACSGSAFAMPPSAVPKLTPTRCCGSSFDHGIPASSSASSAEATENCA